MSLNVENIFNIMTHGEREKMLIKCLLWSGAAQLIRGLGIVLTEEEKKLIATNNMIQAIKSIHLRTNEGIFRSKLRAYYYKEEGK